MPALTSILRSLVEPEVSAKLTGDKVYLRPPELGDWREWQALRHESRDFLIPWEPTWPDGVLSKSTYRARLKRYLREAREDRGYAFFIFRRQDRALVGGLNLNHVHRGVSQYCSVGYWSGQRFARRGYMRDALKVIVPFVFDELRLHRLEAACVPSNTASRDLLRQIGFSEEGYARQYLRIDGAWRDHLLFAYLATDPRP